MLLVVLAMAMLTGCGGETNPAMSFQFTERVFVAIDPATLPEGAVQNQLVGKATNLQMHFAHTEARFGPAQTGPAIVVYQKLGDIPIGTVYTAARVLTLYEAALRDDGALGIVVNPALSGAQSFVMTKAEVKAALPRIMDHKPLPFEPRVARRD